MIRVVIGHRGVGKTSFLERVAAYYLEADRAVWTMNLDEIIEQHEGRSICELFTEVGELGFRELERRYFQQCWETAKALQKEAEGPGQPQVWIAVGAGFVGPIPDEAWVIYLRRTTDEVGRIFLNRPRLEPELRPLAEFHKRRGEREERFASWADEELFLPEGFYRGHHAERDFVLDSMKNVGGYCTLLPHDVKRMQRKADWWGRRKNWQGTVWEVRDDLLSVADLQFVLARIPAQQVLLSFRDRQNVQTTRQLLEVNRQRGLRWDWASELGACPWSENPTVVSFHRREEGESLRSVLERANVGTPLGSISKVAVPIHSFHELLEGHRWAIQNPMARSFLPVSEDGRWQWYRLLTRDLFPVQFWREGLGPNPDQPTLLQWMMSQPRAWEFAAVVGDPVGHSYSPAEHRDYFSGQGLPFLAVPVSRTQFAEGALAVLWELGLRFAAVTAPLKVEAFARAGRIDRWAADFGAVNTLMWDPGERLWRGGNTDVFGLEVLLSDVLNVERIAVWGGGGTLPALQKLLPKASFYSARSGEPRSENLAIDQPEVVVWGAGRHPQGVPPPSHWRPRLVIDLNYTEDSPGREWASEIMAKYRSGIEMFREQARAQRKFWGACGCQ